MAVDTAQKRISATHLLVWSYTPTVIPDGTIGQTDRQAATLVYSGISAGEAQVSSLTKHRGFLRNVGRLLSG